MSVDYYKCEACECIRNDWEEDFKMANCQECRAEVCGDCWVNDGEVERDECGDIPYQNCPFCTGHQTLPEQRGYVEGYLSGLKDARLTHLTSSIAKKLTHYKYADLDFSFLTSMDMDAAVALSEQKGDLQYGKVSDSDVLEVLEKRDGEVQPEVILEQDEDEMLLTKEMADEWFKTGGFICGTEYHTLESFNRIEADAAKLLIEHEDTAGGFLYFSENTMIDSETESIFLSHKGKINDMDPKEWVESIKQAIEIGRPEAEAAETGDIEDWDSYPPLHDAAFAGITEIIEKLIAEGADVNAKIKGGECKGETPLDWAIDGDEEDAINLLRKHGGKTSEELEAAEAAETGDIKAVKQQLAEGADVNAEDEDEYPLHDEKLYLAIKEGDIEAVKKELADGADVNSKNSDGTLQVYSTVDQKWQTYTGIDFTPLDLAVVNGYKEIIELLIEKGADVNAEDDDGNSPLHMAYRGEINELMVVNGCKEIFELLIEKGADVNAKDDNGCSPLHTAYTKEIAELFIANGADVEAKDYYGNTPLHFANSGEIAELLIDNGAGVNAKNSDDCTPLDLALEEYIINLLRKHGGKTGEELEATGN